MAFAENAKVIYWLVYQLCNWKTSVPMVKKWTWMNAECITVSLLTAEIFTAVRISSENFILIISVTFLLSETTARIHFPSNDDHQTGFWEVSLIHFDANVGSKQCEGIQFIFLQTFQSKVSALIKNKSLNQVWLILTLKCIIVKAAITTGYSEAKWNRNENHGQDKLREEAEKRG